MTRVMRLAGLLQHNCVGVKGDLSMWRCETGVRNFSFGFETYINIERVLMWLLLLHCLELQT